MSKTIQLTSDFKGKSIQKLKEYQKSLKKELETTTKFIESVEVETIQSVDDNNEIIKRQMQNIIELQEKENKLLHQVSEIQETLDKKKRRSKTILFAQMAIIPIFLVFLFPLNGISLDSDRDSNTYYTGMFNSKYMVENLRGDTIDTWKSWNILEGEAININLMNSNVAEQDKIDIIKNAILSENVQIIDRSILNTLPEGMNVLYYEGWTGALKSIHTPTNRIIPTEFNIIESKDGQGEIIVFLSNLKDTDGYTGYTKSVVEGDQILKSFITIYDVNNLSDEQIATIFRHEFGHALGLSHSTDIMDLMAPTIDMTNPLISPCNIDAITDLYNGQDEGITTCDI